MIIEQVKFDGKVFPYLPYDFKVNSNEVSFNIPIEGYLELIEKGVLFLMSDSSQICIFSEDFIRKLKFATKQVRVFIPQLDTTYYDIYSEYGNIFIHFKPKDKSNYLPITKQYFAFVLSG
jgi:hypothetical protein